MAGPLSLAVLDGGPRHGQRITVVGVDDGEPARVIEVPDRVGVTPGQGPPPGSSRYRLIGHDRNVNAYLGPPKDSR